MSVQNVSNAPLTDPDNLPDDPNVQQNQVVPWNIVVRELDRNKKLKWGFGGAGVLSGTIVLSCLPAVDSDNETGRRVMQVAAVILFLAAALIFSELVLKASMKKILSRQTVGGAGDAPQVVVEDVD